MSAFLDLLTMPPEAETLGPVPLPAGVRRPAGLDESGPVDRMLLRTPRSAGRSLAEALRNAQALRNARHDDTAGIRVQVDPSTIG
ncbi:hypothetical protein UG54_19490 [Gordonia sihwensis]|nr:hypothetical protein UG54_19490 [Gordonia sihwensis]